MNTRRVNVDYAKERKIHFIMYCFLNGVFDVNAPEFKRHLKGNDNPVVYMRGLNEGAFEQLHNCCIRHVRKLKYSENFKVILHTHLLSVAHFKGKPDMNKKGYMFPQMMFEYINGIWGAPCTVKFNDMLENPNNVVIPKDHFVCVLSRQVRGVWHVNIVLKSDPDDPVWQ